MRSETLRVAQKRKDDEWYTRYEDVEKELTHYSFDGMRVLCPCDSPRSSFTQYFLNNFERLGLKLLTYAWVEPNLTAFMSAFDGKTTTEPISILGFEDARVTAALLNTDIVATNPPFSLCSKKFFKWLAGNKRVNFILVGCNYWAMYKDFFNNYLLGTRRAYPGFEKIHKFNGSDGSVKLLGNVTWFQTLVEHYSRDIPLSDAEYKPENFRYYGTPELAGVPYVERCRDIPKNYMGKISVPASFVLTKQCADYEIVDNFPGKTKRTGLKLADGKPYFSHIGVIRKSKPETI